MSKTVSGLAEERKALQKMLSPIKEEPEPNTSTTPPPQASIAQVSWSPVSERYPSVGTYGTIMLIFM